MLTFMLLLVFPLAMAFAAAMDIVSMTIPNRLTLLLLSAFFPAAWLVGMSIDAVAIHLALAFLFLAFGFGFFVMGWMGGGDAKFMAAAVLWLGPQASVDYALHVAIWGGALTMFILFARGYPMPAGCYRHAWLAKLHHPQTGIPYGIALALAGLLVFPETSWFLYLIAK